MSTNFRVTLRFTDNFQPLAGYSERYDFNDNGAGQSYMTNIANQLVRQRRNVLSSNWQISQVTVGTIVPKLSAKTHKYFNAQTLLQLCPGPTGGAGALGVSDPTNTAFYARWKFESNSRTVARQMRGYPDTWWTNAAPDPSAGALNKFYAFLLGIPLINIATNKTTGASTNQSSLCASTQRISSRRTGRPFLPLRGRRAKRPA